MWPCLRWTNLAASCYSSCRIERLVCSPYIQLFPLRASRRSQTELRESGPEAGTFWTLIDFDWFWWTFMDFDWLLWIPIDFYWLLWISIILMYFDGLLWILMDFDGFRSTLMHFAWPLSIFMYFDGLHWSLVDFARLPFISIDCNRFQ